MPSNGHSQLVSMMSYVSKSASKLGKTMEQDEEESDESESDKEEN